jgi:ribosomal protein RSM22 (predicted rRNA methylase)
MREEVVTKTDKATFRLAKKANWGDLWPQLSMIDELSHEDQTDT